MGSASPHVRTVSEANLTERISAMSHCEQLIEEVKAAGPVQVEGPVGAIEWQELARAFLLALLEWWSKRP